MGRVLIYIILYVGKAACRPRWHNYTISSRPTAAQDELLAWYMRLQSIEMPTRCHVTITNLRVIALKTAEQTVRLKYGTIGSPENVPALGSLRPHLSKSPQKGTKTWSRWQSGGFTGCVPLRQAAILRSRRESRTCRTTRLASLVSLGGLGKWGVHQWGYLKMNGL